MTQPGRPGDFRSAAACGSVALIACLIVIYATPNDTVWTVDCGAKALLAKQFVETNFSRLAFDYPAATVDPAGKAFPIPPPFAVRMGDAFVSQYPPAYPATAAAFYALLGPPGLRWPAALGVSACAFLFALWATPAFGKRGPSRAASRSRRHCSSMASRYGNIRLPSHCRSRRWWHSLGPEPREPCSPACSRAPHAGIAKS